MRWMNANFTGYRYNGMVGLSIVRRDTPRAIKPLGDSLHQTAKITAPRNLVHEIRQSVLRIVSTAYELFKNSRQNAVNCFEVRSHIVDIDLDIKAMRCLEEMISVNLAAAPHKDGA